MNHKFCAGHHDDKKQASWRDTAGRLWREYACNACGRLRREPEGQ